MAKPEDPYRLLKVESFIASSTSEKKRGSAYSTIAWAVGDADLAVECSKKLSDKNIYPVGSQFEITAKLTDRGEGGEYIYSSFRWEFK